MARDEHGLSYLQPGRFVCTGSLGEVRCLCFAPLNLPAFAQSFCFDDRTLPQPLVVGGNAQQYIPVTCGAASDRIGRAETVMKGALWFSKSLSVLIQRPSAP